MSEYVLADEAATTAFGERLARCTEPGCLIFLRGDLGAGKTTLARGFLRGLGYAGRVKSPTYTLVEPYDTPRGVAYHLDLYRLADPEELEWIGIRDVLDGSHRCLIEWPQRGLGILPDPDLTVELEMDDRGRQLTILAYSMAGKRALTSFQYKS